MIVLFGATGYTGRLTAAELAAAGEPFVVAGRSRAKLDELVAELGRVHPSTAVSARVADVGDRGSLDAMVEGASAIVSTVGPFERYGMVVVEAAVAAGVPYCDSTGEPGFMRRVSERFADSAVPVSPACGFDYVPHDLAAAEAAEGLGADVEAVDTALLVRRMSPSRGTAASALGAITTESVEWGGGTWRPTRMASVRRQVDFPAPTGTRSAVSYPGGDSVQIARHIPSARVRSFMVLPGAAAAAASAVMPLSRAVFGLGPVQALAERLLARMPDGPSEETRNVCTWDVLAVATGGGRESTAVASGTDPYGFTARALTECVSRLARWTELGIEPGFRAPAEICGDRSAFAKTLGFELRQL